MSSFLVKKLDKFAFKNLNLRFAIRESQIYLSLSKVNKVD